MNTQNIQNQEFQKECIRAVDGEKVWVILNHVKPDRREEFERFMHEIIRKIATKSELHVLNRTRILHPLFYDSLVSDQEGYEVIQTAW